MPETSFNPVHFESDFARRGQSSIDDAGIYELSSLPWELMTNVKAKHFQFDHEYLVTPSITLQREYFLSKMHIIGMTPPGRLSLSIPLRCGYNTAYWRQSNEAGRLPISMFHELDVTVDAGQSHIILTINLDLLRKFYSAERIEMLEVSAQQHFMRLSADTSTQLANWLCQILDHTLENHYFLSSQSAVQAFEEELLHRLAAAMDSSAVKIKRMHISLRQKGLKNALDYLYSQKQPLINIPELCKHSGVSQRTLEYAFKETFNLTPIRFINELRLHSLRSKLLQANTDETILNVAYECRLTQLGRVAREYKHLFHELPSETLKRDVDKSIANNQVLLW